MPHTPGYVLAKLGLAIGDRGDLSLLQSLHHTLLQRGYRFMQEPLESAPAADIRPPPLPSPPPRHEVPQREAAA